MKSTSRAVISATCGCHTKKLRANMAPRSSWSSLRKNDKQRIVCTKNETETETNNHKKTVEK